MAPVNQNPYDTFGNTLDGPATAPPAGVQPNFTHPSNQNQLVHAVLIVVLTITSVFSLIRAYTRVFLKRWTISDVLGLAASAFYVGFVYLCFKLETSFGWFVHMWDKRLRDFPTFNQIYFQGLILYYFVLLLIKSAILLEWVAIFVPARTRGFFFWLSYFVLTLHVLFYVSAIIVALVGCTPFERNWNPLIPGKCLNTTGITVAISAINLTFDVIILLLPQKIIWGLQMHTQRKVGISALFAMGVLGCIAAAFRLSSSLQFNKSRDTTYEASGLALWCLAEATCGFIIFCGSSAAKAFSHLEMHKLVSNLRSWARTSLGKSASQVGSRKGSVPRATRKMSSSPGSQDGDDKNETYQQAVPLEFLKKGLNPLVVQDRRDSHGSDVAIIQTT